MNTYLIGTTTDEKWEIIGGSYIINALTKKKAIQIWEGMPYHNCCEKITDVKRISVKTAGVKFSQEPIVE